MSTIAGITSPVLSAKTGWQLFSSCQWQINARFAWKNPSYRQKFVLRSLLKPLGTAKLLSSLAQHPDLLLMLNAQPGLPCRLHRPWLSLTFDEKKHSPHSIIITQPFVRAYPPLCVQVFYAAGHHFCRINRQKWGTVHHPFLFGPDAG
jgi:hypothetical protein